MMTTVSPTPPVEHRIDERIALIRGVRVMIDADLAALYGVPTRRLNEQVKRNPARFPPDFMWQLTAAEKAEVIARCDHLARLKYAKSLPFAFTEFGAIQVASVLASRLAVEMGIFVVRAFVQLREASSSQEEVRLRLKAVEARTDALALAQDADHRQLVQLLDALQALMNPVGPPAPEPPKRQIGFLAADEPDGPA